MQSAKRKALETVVALLAFGALGMLSTAEALCGERLPRLAAEDELQLATPKWSGELPTEALKIQMLQWIGANSSYNVSGLLTNPPEVRFCEHGATFIYEGKAIHFDDRLNGVYDEKTKRICLAKPWHASSPKDRSVLLHELVHHVQFENHAWPCPKAAEWEAYKLQETWLLEHGMALDLPWVYILLDSSCSPRDKHP